MNHLIRENWLGIWDKFKKKNCSTVGIHKSLERNSHKPLIEVRMLGSGLGVFLYANLEQWSPFSSPVNVGSFNPYEEGIIICSH